MKHDQRYQAQFLLNEAGFDRGYLAPLQTHKKDQGTLNTNQLKKRVIVVGDQKFFDFVTAHISKQNIKTYAIRISQYDIDDLSDVLAILNYDNSQFYCGIIAQASPLFSVKKRPNGPRQILAAPKRSPSTLVGVSSRVAKFPIDRYSSEA